ncbi:MAG: hypothetical protein OEL76_15175 [Siculibacillus sp.]|nr:hypothetical protein [Siculibacillus sp.]
MAARFRRLGATVLIALAHFCSPVALASGGHEAPPAAAAPAEPPPPPPPPSPRLPPPDVRPPIDGPIAAPAPKARVPILADRLTGVALGGYDPVIYFLEDRPALGHDRFQWDWGGTTWWFRNEGDLAAFRAAPEVFAPLFAGRCAFAVARGRPAEGSPLHHLVLRGRLLLFADALSRRAFLEDPDRLLAEATRRWPAMAVDLE